MIDIGEGVKIQKQKWFEISSPDKNPSLFTKSLAMAIWGTDELKERTVLGKESSRLKSNGESATLTRPSLTPEKVKVIKDRLRDHLQPVVSDRSLIERESQKVNKYINEKIWAIQRSAK